MAHHPYLESRFPRSLALGLEFVASKGSDAFHLAFDSEEVRAKLGEAKFNQLMGGLKEVMCCNHRSHPADHPDERLAGTEVHCIWADDLEKFLEAN
ncbi:MAG TPA: hypothetical protein VGQ12_07675 [Candidatus Angelobacter sp.]|jgi:hypothetical protein|nr:hypothetical protein [Candidatus Angelobacter sp.]